MIGRYGFLAAAWLLTATNSVRALDYVSFQRDGKPVHVTGKVLWAEDGGVMVLDRDGVLWIVQPAELVRRTKDDAAFEPFGRDKLAEKLRREMPPGSKIYSTAHFLICYNTSKAYVQRCGALYERLYRYFYAYWSRQGLELREPEFPLVSLVFDSKRSYTAYAERDLGKEAAEVITLGYYSLLTNRVTAYGLPGAEQNVATIVHEATHQLTYNSGLHARFADIPLWVCEGIAIFFETPDFRKSRGWGTIGAVNRRRLTRFQRYLRNRPEDSLHSLLTGHSRFRQSNTASDAYAETWALTYYLLHRRKKEYCDYLAMLARKEPLVDDGPERRITEFKAAFGEDLRQFDKQFVGYMLKVR